MKRKASEPDNGIAWNAWSSSSDRSASSKESVVESTIGRPTWASVRVQQVPDQGYMNLRTKKRVRDNRPDMEIVHQNTIARLFDAQRQHRFHEVASARSSDAQNSIPTQPAQQNLHSFFNIGHCQPPGRYDISQKIFHRLEACETCEDCGNKLGTMMYPATCDAEMTDVDTISGASFDEDYACAGCSRKVCDICAVRGDRRICLECAIPGGGMMTQKNF